VRTAEEPEDGAGEESRTPDLRITNAREMAFTRVPNC